MKDSGKTIKLMAKAVTNMQMGLLMQESGKMINNMEKESKPGQMELSMKVHILKGRSMVEAL